MVVCGAGSASLWAISTGTGSVAAAAARRNKARWQRREMAEAAQATAEHERDGAEDEEQLHLGFVWM